MLNLNAENLALDATDALSVALCHHYQAGRIPSNTKTSWSAFLKDNPARVKG
jgi:crossover junction endodeoxyribonuclease RuvC